MIGYRIKEERIKQWEQSRLTQREFYGGPFCQDKFFANLRYKISSDF
jgi:hypothetical protein